MAKLFPGLQPGGMAVLRFRDISLSNSTRLSRPSWLLSARSKSVLSAARSKSAAVGRLLCALGCRGKSTSVRLHIPSANTMPRLASRIRRLPHAGRRSLSGSSSSMATCTSRGAGGALRRTGHDRPAPAARRGRVRRPDEAHAVPAPGPPLARRVRGRVGLLRIRHACGRR